MDRKPIFDAARKMLGRGFRKLEVEALDRAIDAGESEVRVPWGMVTGPDGRNLIKRFEGCARMIPGGLVEAYPDPGTGGAPWTIGWGHTGPEVGPGTIWTQAQCDAQLGKDLQRFESDVRAAIGSAPTSQAQFDALVAFHYNTGAIGRATLTKLHKAGKYEAAAEEFGKWVHAGGRVLKGLVRRRAEEARLYRGAA